MQLQVKITGTPIADMIKMVQPPQRKELFREIGRRVDKLAKNNAMAKGGRSFWGEIAKTVRFQADDSGVIVGATHYAAAHKHKGGTISAPGKGPESRNRKYLAIPIADESKRLDPGNMSGLFLGRSKGGNPILFKKIGDEIKPMFLLRRSVKQKAYPWFPEPGDAKTNAAIESGANAYFAKLKLKT